MLSIKSRAALTLLAISISTSSSAAVFGEDDRFVPRERVDSPYAPIGVVRPLSGLGSWAFPRYTTGFLIDDCDILTVQHLLGDDSSPLGKRVRFTGGFSTPNRMTSHGTVVVAGGLQHYSGYNRKVGSKRYENARAHDWMVVRLDHCIGRNLGFVHLSKELPGWSVKSAGFPNYIFREPLHVDPACRIRYQTDLLWLNDCASASGNSGSPIFSEIQEHGHTVLYVYAMQSAGWSSGGTMAFSWNRANVATPVRDIMHQMAAIGADRKLLASR